MLKGHTRQQIKAVKKISDTLGTGFQITCDDDWRTVRTALDIRITIAPISLRKSLKFLSPCPPLRRRSTCFRNHLWNSGRVPSAQKLEMRSQMRFSYRLLGLNSQNEYLNSQSKYLNSHNDYLNWNNKQNM
jgi:hypothetical protein